MIKSTDLYIIRSLEYMIQDLRKNRFLVKDILSDVNTHPLLKDIYGMKEIENFNKFLNKEIQVNVEYAIDMARLPAIAVRIGGGVEDVGRTGDPLSDGHELEEGKASDTYGVFPTPRIVIGPITAIEYDSKTGKVTFPDTVDLKSVYSGMFLFDEANKKSYEIVLVDSATTLYLKPKLKDKINFNNCTIRSPFPDKVIHTRRWWFANEQVTITCLSVDPVEVIYLYQMILYLIGRHRVELFEGTNFRVATIQYGPIQRMMDDPNIVFGREINLSGSVYHSYIEKTGRPIEGTKNQVYVSDMGTPDAVWDAQVSGQGWAGELDIDKDIS